MDYTWHWLNDHWKYEIDRGGGGDPPSPSLPLWPTVICIGRKYRRPEGKFEINFSRIWIIEFAYIICFMRVFLYWKAHFGSIHSPLCAPSLFFPPPPNQTDSSPRQKWSATNKSHHHLISLFDRNHYYVHAMDCAWWYKATPNAASQLPLFPVAGRILTPQSHSRWRNYDWRAASERRPIGAR